MGCREKGDGMNPLEWIKWAPWLISAALALALAGMTGQYLHKRDELTELTASVRVLGEAAEKRVAQAKKEGDDNLKKVKADHEKQIPAVRAGAVAAYRARFPARVVRDSVTAVSAVPDNPASVRMDDAPGAQCVPDESFIADAAEDAAKVEAWRSWCILNRCPVE